MWSTGTDYSFDGIIFPTSTAIPIPTNAHLPVPFFPLLSKGMIAKFVPVILSFVQSKGAGDVVGLLTKVLQK